MSRNPYPGRGGGNPLFPPSVVTNRAGIDLRQEMEDIFKGTAYDPPQAHWIILRRVDVSSFSENYVGDQWDETIGGPMFEYQDYAVLTRYRGITSGTLSRFFEQEIGPGLLHVDYRIYYFQHTSLPKKEDWIYEINYEGGISKPPKPANIGLESYIERYNINDVVPYRGDHGRVEFYACLCKRDRVF